MTPQAYSEIFLKKIFTGSKNKIFVMVFVLVLLLSFGTAKSFTIFNSSNSAVPYFSVNGSTGYVGVGTENPLSALQLPNDGWLSSRNAADTGIVNMFKVNSDNQIEVGGTLNVGNFEFSEDSGLVTFVDMPVSSTPALGTVESYVFKIDGENLLSIYSEADSSGGIQNKRVGIGTVSPSYPLDVVGTINAYDVLVNGTAISASSLGAVSGSGTAWRIPMWNGTTSLNNSNIYQSGSNVGIGTISPTAKLQIANNGTYDLSQGLSFGDGDSGIHESSDDSIALNIANQGKFFFQSDGLKRGGTGGFHISTSVTTTDPVYTFQNDDNTGFGRDGADEVYLMTNGSKRLFVNSDGNVGIGTTSPQQKLHVAGNGLFNGSLSFDTNVSSITNEVSLAPNGTGTIYLRPNGLGSDTAALSLGSTGLLTLTGTSTFKIEPSATTSIGTTTSNDLSLITNSQDRITINGSSGNVGIGDSTPSYKLDVAGIINGYDLLVNGSSVLTSVSDVWVNASGDTMSGTLNMDDNLITNIGNSGTDFTSGGGLQLAGTFDPNGEITLPTTGISGAGTGSGLDADKLDGVEGSTYFKDGDVVMNTNSFGGRDLYINSFNNAYFRADKRWVVTGNLYYNSNASLYGSISASNLDNLFDGNYETSLIIPAGTYATVNINFSTESSGYYPGYPYGEYYLSHYYTYFPDASVTNTDTVSVYTNYAPHTIGWHEYNFTDFLRTSSLITSKSVSRYQLSQVEFKIHANDVDDRRVTQVDMQLDRPGTNEMPFVDKFKTNTLYDDLTFESGDSTTKISLNPAGVSYFNTGSDFVIGGSSASGSLMLDVAGQIGGTQYCDENGANCVDIANVLTTSSDTEPFWTGNYSAYNSTWTTTDAEIWNVAGNGTLMFASDWNSTNTSYVPYTGASSNLVLGDNNFSVGGSDLFVDNVGGNVGIGTTTPQNTLNVVGSSNFSGSVLMEGTNTLSFDSIGSEYINSPTAGNLDFAARGIMKFYAETNTNEADTTPMFEFHTSDAVGAGTAKMVILDNGKVGIGTESPSADLTILNVSSSSTAYKFWVGRGTAEGFGMAVDDSTVYFDSDQDEDIPLYGNMKFRVDDDGTADGYFDFGTLNAVSYMRIIDGGNVGIGTTNPARELHVNGDILSNATINATGDICIEGGNCLSSLSATTGTLTGSGTAMRVPLWNGTSSLNNSNIYQGGSGNVGIGTVSPDADLEVVGNAIHLNGVGNTYFRLDRGADTNRGVINYQTAGANKWYVGMSANGAAGDGTEYFIGSSSGGENAKLWIETTGDVGIGTTTPQNKLNVVGDVNVTSGGTEFRVESGGDVHFYLG
jgi:hypothetical protein